MYDLPRLSGTPLVWALGAATLPLVAAAVARGLEVLRERETRRWIATAGKLGLQYSPEPLSYFRRYRALDVLLSHTNLDSTLKNHLYGSLKSQPLDMVEYSYAQGDSDTAETTHMTLVIFPLAEQRLPIFRLQPQTSPKLLRTVLGEPGTVFWESNFRAKPKQNEPDRPKKHAFHDHYAMTCGYSPVQRELVEISPRIATPSTEDPARLEVQIRRLFDESLLQFFVNTPGWHVECSGKYVAVWETGRFVPQDDLETYLLDALHVADHVRGAWQHPQAEADAAREVDVVSGTQYRSQFQTNMLCAVVGACFGLIVGIGSAYLVSQFTGEYAVQPAFDDAAVPTPVIVDGRRLRVGSVMLRFRTGPGAVVHAVHIYDGERRIAAHDGLSLSAPRYFVWPRFDVPEHPYIKWGLGLSIGVKFGDGANLPTDKLSIDVSSAGCDFVTKA